MTKAIKNMHLKELNWYVKENLHFFSATGGHDFLNRARDYYNIYKQKGGKKIYKILEE